MTGNGDTEPILNSAGNSRHALLSQDIIRRLGEDHLDNTSTPDPILEHKAWFGKRHILSFMGFIGFANVYAMRVNLSVAIVAMVNNTAIPHVNTTVEEVCEYPGDNSTIPTQDGEFVWDETIQGLILGSFFYGYIFTNFLGGRLGELIGGKIVFAVGVLCTSILTILTPVVANTNNVPLLVALRVAEGLGEDPGQPTLLPVDASFCPYHYLILQPDDGCLTCLGVTFPAMNSLMARWIPPLERSKASAIVYAGAQFGTVVALPISGILCESTFLGGWPSVFYVFGVAGLLWFIIWMFLISNTPASHPTISLEEKVYIQTTLNQLPNQKSPEIPWRHILMSMPFWAILMGHVAQNWGFYFLLTEMPTYMKNILHFNIADNSLISALPYFCMWIFSIVAGVVADKLRQSGILSTTATRRIFNSIGIYGPMVCLVLVGYAGCDYYAAIGLLCGAVGLNGAVYSGYMNSHLDIAPNFAGTLMGITNTVATIPGFLAPQIVGYLISGEETLSRWQLIFWIAGIVYFVGNTFYVIFISGELQPWNDIDLQGKAKEKEDASNQRHYGAISDQDNQNHQGISSSRDAPRSSASIPEIF